MLIGFNSHKVQHLTFVHQSPSLSNALFKKFNTRKPYETLYMLC